MKEAAANTFMSRSLSRRRSSLAYQRAVSSRRSSSASSGGEEKKDDPNDVDERINEAIAKALQTSRRRKDVLEGLILSRVDLLGGKESEKGTGLGDDDSTKHARRKTSLVTIDLASCGNPPINLVITFKSILTTQLAKRSSEHSLGT